MALGGKRTRELGAGPRKAPAAGDDVLAWKLPVTFMVIFDLFGQMAEIIPGLRSALAITRKLSDRNAEAWVLTCLAEAYQDVGQPDESIKCCRSASAISAEIGDWYSQWLIRYLEGVACLSLERYDEASYYIRQSLAIARQASDIRTEGMSLTWLGAVHERLGSFETAISMREQAVAALEQARNRWQYAYALRKLADACHHYGRAADAIDYY